MSFYGGEFYKYREKKRGPQLIGDRLCPSAVGCPAGVCGLRPFVRRSILLLQVNRNLPQFKIQNSKLVLLFGRLYVVVFWYYRIVICFYAHSKFKIQNSKLILLFSRLYVVVFSYYR